MNQKPKPEYNEDPYAEPREGVVNKVDNSVHKTEYGLILGLRRIKEGSFKGLWELTELSGDCSVKRVITDANVKASVINLAARAIGDTL